MEGFISRYINDTRHIAIRLRQYIKTELSKEEKVAGGCLLVFKPVVCVCVFDCALHRRDSRDGWNFQEAALEGTQRNPARQLPNWLVPARVFDH